MKKILLSILVSVLLGLSTLSAQHLKMDGTPDMRYKENRSTYALPTFPSTYTTHLKKDGTPDLRYKENKSNYSSDQWHASSGASHYYSYGVNRDSHGKIERSSAAKMEFMKQTGYPHGRPGYVVDHIVPLKRGGCDCPTNMQWQTIADAKAKDKWE